MKPAIRAGFSSDPGIVTLSDCRLVGRSSGQTDESLISFFSVTDFDDPPILQVGRTVLQGGGTCIEVACNEASVLFGLGNCVLRDAYYGVRMQGVPTTPDPFHGALLHCTLRNLEVAVDEPSSFLQLFDVNFRFNLFEGNGLDVGSNVNFDPLSSDNYTDLTPPSGTSSFTQVSGLSGMFADCTEMLRPDATILGVVSSGSGIDLYGRTYTGDSDPGAVYHFSADQLVTQHPAVGEDVCLATHGPAGDTWFLVVGTSLVSTTPYALQVNPVDYPAFGAVDSTGFAQYPGTGQTPITIPNQPAFYTTPLYWQVGFQDPVTMALTFTHSAIRTDAGSIAE